MKPLSRRTFLQGAGTLVALPLLEAMIPSTARAQRPIPRRFIGYFVPCGIHMAAFTPMAEGAEFALTPILEPLAAHRSNVMVLSGLANLPGRPDGAGDHAGGTGSFMGSAALPTATGGFFGAASVTAFWSGFASCAG